MAQQFEIEILATTAASTAYTHHGQILCSDASGAAIEAYTVLFADEFSLYPKLAIEKSQLERVVLCEKLSFDGQRRSAVPDFAKNTLYLDVRNGEFDELYQRQVIHHEFFHIIDYRDDGELYEDADWMTLNPADFSYGTGGANAQEIANTGLLTTQYPGFLNHYSTTGVEEDKAELFGYLLVSTEHVVARAANDPVLRAKVARMKQLFADFCGGDQDGFWNRQRETSPR